VERKQRDQLLGAVMNRDLEIFLAPLWEELRDKVLHHNLAVMADIIRNGVGRGELRSTDPEKTAFVLWTTADALLFQKHFRYEDVLPTYIGIVRDGLRDRETPSSDFRAARCGTKSKEKK
jgi:hypothetical protein